MTLVGYQETLEMMQKKLGGLVPDFELADKAHYVVEINRLKKERNAIILGHNYMEPALYHCVADITGDSLNCVAELPLPRQISSFSAGLSLWLKPPRYSILHVKF